MGERLATSLRHCLLRASRDPEGAGPPARAGERREKSRWGSVSRRLSGIACCALRAILKGPARRPVQACASYVVAGIPRSKRHTLGEVAMEERIATSPRHCLLRASRDPEGAGPPARAGEESREVAMGERIATSPRHCLLRASRDPEGAGPPARTGEESREVAMGERFTGVAMGERIATSRQALLAARFARS